MTLLELGTALLAVVPECYHYTAHEKTDKYIVWAEDGQAGALYADGVMYQQSIAGTVHYYTHMEFDPNFDRIQTVLNGSGAAWRLESVQYEDDTKYIHYEWSFELPQGVG